MDVLATPSTAPSEEPLVLKSSQPDNSSMALGSNLKTSDLSFQPSFVHIDVDSYSKYSKDVVNTGGSSSGVSPQIQASAYINDSETLSIPTGNTSTSVDFHQGLNEPPFNKSTTLFSTTLQPETTKHAPTLTPTPTPTPTPTAVLTLQPEVPPSQLQLGSEPTHLSSSAVASSNVSILSASGTLVSHEVQGRLSTSTDTPAPHPLSRTTTANTLSVSVTPFDLQQFKATLQRIATLTEQFEALNDQLLDALTGYDESRLGLDCALSGTHLTAEPVPRDESSTDLEVKRRVVAQSLVDLISSSWSRLARSGSTTVHPTLNLPIQAQPPPQKMVRFNKPQIKAATHLKNTIVTLWSAQSNLHDRAQLVLDIFQDPIELEDEGRVRSLRSRHLNNLLSTSLTPTETDRLSNKVSLDQDRMTQITEQLQGVWLEILLVLSTPRTTTNKLGDLDTESDEGDNMSIGKRFLRIGKSKRQAFKNFLGSW
ncbi:hypothetical protein EC991_007150 [Linnemannia zychae]|nr:hypothetical protein EC991_007150 [Linnemannia zychae]